MATPSTVEKLLKELLANKKDYDAGQMRVALQCIDRLAVMAKRYPIILTPPTMTYSQKTPTLDKEGQETTDPNKLSIEEIIAKLEENNGTDQSSNQGNGG